MLLYIVRHGDPIYETDTLTERGRQQAEAVSKRMQRAGINQIYSSPMGRARETAAPTCELLNLPCQIEEWAHEIGDERLTPYPDGKLKSITNLQNTVYRRDGNINLSYEDAYTCTGICETRMREAVAFIEQNGRDFLHRLGYQEENGVYRILRPNEDRVALFCHAALTRAWLSTLLHIPLHMMWSSFSLTHTGITVLEFRNNPDGFTAPQCLCFSDTSHLYAEGLDLKHCNKIEV